MTPAKSVHKTLKFKTTPANPLIQKQAENAKITKYNFLMNLAMNVARSLDPTPTKIIVNWLNVNKIKRLLRVASVRIVLLVKREILLVYFVRIFDY